MRPPPSASVLLPGVPVSLGPPSCHVLPCSTAQRITQHRPRPSALRPPPFTSCKNPLTVGFRRPPQSSPCVAGGGLRCGPSVCFSGLCPGLRHPQPPVYRSKPGATCRREVRVRSPTPPPQPHLLLGHAGGQPGFSIPRREVRRGPSSKPPVLPRSICTHRLSRYPALQRLKQ